MEALPRSSEIFRNRPAVPILPLGYLELLLNASYYPSEHEDHDLFPVWNKDNSRVAPGIRLDCTVTGPKKTERGRCDRRRPW